MATDLERFRQFFGYEDWNLGILAQPADDIVRHGIRVPARWLDKPSRWEMLADPGCRLRPDGGITLYAEWLDHWGGCGEIWAADIPAGGDPAGAVFRPAVLAPVHLSYPFPFTDDEGRPCLTAEAWEAYEAPLWCELDARWRRVRPLFPGRPAVDPTLWRGPDRWWLFCTFEDDLPNERLHLFHAAAVQGPWQPHPANPVKTDPASSRPAGPLLSVDGILVRPAQDCSRTYGGAIVLNAVRRLDEEGFAEESWRRLEPLPGPFPHGLHTFCPAGEVTVVDGKRWRYHALQFVRRWNVNRTAHARHRRVFATGG